MSVSDTSVTQLLLRDTSLLLDRNNDGQYDLSNNPVIASHKIPILEDEDCGSSGPGDRTRGQCLHLERVFYTSVPGDRPHRSEATGQAMDAASKGVMHSSAAFMGPALIQLATRQACREHQNSDDCAQSSVNLFGLHIKPSSLLTMSSVFATLVSAVVLPLLGAAIDRSGYRKAAGAVSAAALVVINVAQIGLSQDNWPFFWVLHSVSDIVNQIHQVIVLAYLYELTNNATALALYSSKFAFTQLSFMVSYMVFIIMLARFERSDMVATSRVAHVVSGALGVLLMSYAWMRLFPPRDQLHQPTPDEGSIVYRSLLGLRTTLGRIRTSHPALKWLLITSLWSPDVGSSAYLSIFSTVQKSLLQMNSAQIGVSTLLTMISMLFGARLSGFLCVRINALWSFRGSVAVLMLAAGASATLLRGPQQIPVYYAIATLQGLAFGWFIPTERVLFCTLIPPGQEAEMMGLIVCVNGSAAWLPPLLFSAIDEAGWSLRWALASQNIILGLALVCSLGIGDYQKAVQQARNPDRQEQSECTNLHGDSFLASDEYNTASGIIGTCD